MGRLWMLITKDKYELPILVANTERELAELCGVKTTSIAARIKHAKDRREWSRYVKVEWDDKEDDG